MNLFKEIYIRCQKASHKLALTLVGAFVVVGWSCSDYDDSFGDGFLPSSQDMELRTWENNTSFTTSLFMSDSVRSSNVGIAVMGAERSTRFGERRAGFFSQFTPVHELNSYDDDDWVEEYPFGYSPMFDSLVLILTLLEYSGDTIVPQTFELYEVLDASFLEGSRDSVYFDNFKWEEELKLAGSEPIFTFTFPDQDNEIYVNSTYVRLMPYPDPTASYSQMSDATRSFIDRLLLQDDGADNNIYDWDYRTLFLDKFQGMYIKPTYTPETPTVTLEPKGAIYSFYTDGLGLAMYGRNLYGEDIPIVKDTIAMAYSCRNLTTYDTDSDYYGILINTIERDDEPYTLDVETSTLLVEGMGGVAGQITIEEEILREVYDDMLSVPDKSGDGVYNSIFVNDASLYIYLTQEAGVMDYDYKTLSPLVVTEWMDDAPSRLGLYTLYSDYYIDDDAYDDDESILEGIEDYYYEYELYYSVLLPFNGYMNRSFASYNMIISAQFQDVWNSYLDAIDAAGGDPDAVNMDDVEGRTFYLAPVADNLYTVKQVALQGMSDGANTTAPIRLKLTYTLIKR